MPTAPNHKWSLRTKLRGYGNRVLDVAKQSTENGVTVALWDDTPGAPNEVFDIYP